MLPPPKGSPTTLMVLGADGPLGRDEFIRVLDGGKASIEVGVFAVLISALIAVPLGCLAGFYGGKVDAVISRLTEWVMAFPLIFFLVFATVHLTPALRPIGWGHDIPAGVPMVALLIGVFTSFYPLRLVRAQLLTLRNAEFVDSSRMVGASGLRIIRKDLLPHLVPTLLVWGAVAVATDMLLEVGLSVIGVGVQASTATWGTLLAQTTGTIYNAGFGEHGRRAPHDVAHRLADDRDSRLRRLAQPALGEHAPGDRALAASMKRIGAFLARRIAGGVADARGDRDADVADVLVAVAAARPLRLPGRDQGHRLPAAATARTGSAPTGRS